MRPLFPFYGSKWRDARRYPAPVSGVVVEPFAGSAGYSTYWAPEKVTLYDVDPIIVGVWDYLIHVSGREILNLPDLEVGQSTDSLKIPQEARWLIGFWLNRGSAQPKKTKTAYSARTERSQLVWSERARTRIARDIEGVRHWEIRHGSYADTPDPGIDVTWFIDPPYVEKGRYYRFKDIDYPALATWTLGLMGDVIVCENTGASWLPFSHMATVKSSRGVSREAVYIQRKGVRDMNVTTFTTSGGTVYEPWSDGHAIGFRVTAPNGGREYIYLNPSDSDSHADADVFLYQGSKGDPAYDVPAHYYGAASAA